MKIIIIGFIRVVIMLAAFLHEMHARECLRKHVLINIPEFIEPSGTVVISINGIILESKIQDLSKLIEAYDKQNMTVVYRGYGSHDKIKDEILEIETHRKLIQNIHLSTNYIDRTLYYGKI